MQHSKFVATIRQLAGIATVSLLLLAAPAVAADTIDERVRSAFADAYGQGFRTSRLAGYVSGLFSQFDHDRNGITAAEIDLAEQILRARQRARRIGQVLRYDLDGDGTVTRKEVRAHTIGQGRFARSIHNGKLSERDEARLARMIDRVMQVDPDNDGRIDPEDYAGLKPLTGYRDHQLGPVRLARELLALDPDQNGRLSQVEVMGMVARAFAASR